MLGAVSVGIYTTNAPDACHYVLHHSESMLCVCQGGKQAEKIYGIRNQLPNLFTWDEWMKSGEETPDEEILAEAAKVQPGNCATLIYTSGTTVWIE